MRHYLMYRECKISEITKSSEKLRGFFMHKEGVQKGKIPPCRIGYLISVSNRDTNKSRVPNTFWTPSLLSLKDLCSGINILSRLFTICIPQTK